MGWQSFASTCRWQCPEITQKWKYTQIYTSTVVPMLIRDLATAKENISYNKCIIHLFTAHLLVGMEIVILLSITLDQNIDTVKPQPYIVIINKKRYNNMLIVLCQWSQSYSILYLLSSSGYLVLHWKFWYILCWAFC